MSSLGRTIVVFGSRLLIRGAQVISFVVLARTLSPADFGTYGVITSAVFLVGMIGHLGLRPAGAYVIGQRTFADGTVAATVLLAWPALALLSCLALWATGVLPAGQPLIDRAAIVVATAGVLLIALAQGVYLGRGETGYFALSESAPRIGAMVATMVAWLTVTITIGLALQVFALSFALFVPVAIYLMFKGTGHRRPALRAFGPMIRFGFLFAVSVSLVMLQGRVGLFFLASVGADAAAGQFFAAQRATEMFLEIATAFGLVLFSETARSTDPDLAIRGAVRAAGGLFLLFLVIGIASLPFTPLLVRTLLGANYRDAAPLLGTLLLGLGFAAATRIMNNVMAGLGRPYMSAGVALIALALNAGLCAWLVPSMGASGAVIALLAGQAMAAVAYFVLAVSCWRIRLADLLPRNPAATVRQARSEIFGRRPREVTATRPEA